MKSIMWHRFPAGGWKRVYETASLESCEIAAQTDQGTIVESESERYYIRLRGRVTGPYSSVDLKRMVARGTLTRIHEVSQDATSWVSAQTLAELFAEPRPSGNAQLSDHRGAEQPECRATPRGWRGDTEASSGGALDEILHESDGSTACDEQFYYAQGDVLSGPVGLAALRALAADGRLKPDDLVTRKGDDLWLPAAQTDAFASSDTLGQTSEDVHPAGGESLASHSSLAGRQSWSTSRVSGLSLVGGVSSATVVLFCLNVPHDRLDGNVRWWWHLFADSATVIIASFSSFAVISSIGLLLIATLSTSRMRAKLYVFYSLACLLFLVTTGMLAAGTAYFLFLPTFVMVGCASMIPTVRLQGRRATPGAWHGSGKERRGMTLLVVLGALTLAAIVCLIDISVVVLSGSLESAGYTLGQVVLAIVLGLTGCLCAGIYSAMGILAGSGIRMSRVGLGTTILVAVAGVLLPVSCMMIGYKIAAAPAPGNVGPALVGGAGLEASRFLLVQMLRFVVIAYALMGLLSLGVWEWLNPDPPQCSAIPRGRRDVAPSHVGGEMET